MIPNMVMKWDRMGTFMKLSGGTDPSGPSSCLNDPFQILFVQP